MSFNNIIYLKPASPLLHSAYANKATPPLVSPGPPLLHIPRIPLLETCDITNEGSHVRPMILTRVCDPTCDANLFGRLGGHACETSKLSSGTELS